MIDNTILTSYKLSIAQPAWLINQKYSLNKKEQESCPDTIVNQYTITLRDNQSQLLESTILCLCTIIQNT